MSGADDYINKLIETAPLRETVIRDAINYLNLPEGSFGLDAGCGIGLHLPMLADAIGKDSHIVGLDLSTDFLKHAQSFVKESGVRTKITFQKGDVSHLPFDNDTFDWVWSVDCIGYAPMDLLPILKELSRVVKPGGVIVILAYSSQQFFPGYPELEAKLNATTSGIAPFTKGSSPKKHFLNSLHWLEKAGLVDCTARTFISNVVVPLSDAIRKAMLSLIQMRWDDNELSPEDSELFRRLTDPDSPEYILYRRDYHGFFTYTMFFGQVPE